MLVRDPIAMRKHELVGTDRRLLRARTARAPDLGVLDTCPRLDRLWRSEPFRLRVADTEKGGCLPLPEATERSALDLDHWRTEVRTRRGAPPPEELSASPVRRRSLQRPRPHHLPGPSWFPASAGGSFDRFSLPTIRSSCCLLLLFADPDSSCAVDSIDIVRILSNASGEVACPCRRRCSCSARSVTMPEPQTRASAAADSLTKTTGEILAEVESSGRLRGLE